MPAQKPKYRNEPPREHRVTVCRPPEPRLSPEDKAWIYRTHGGLTGSFGTFPLQTREPVFPLTPRPFPLPGSRHQQPEPEAEEYDDDGDDDDDYPEDEPDNDFYQ